MIPENRLCYGNHISIYYRYCSKKSNTRNTCATFIEVTIDNIINVVKYIHNTVRNPILVQHVRFRAQKSNTLPILADYRHSTSR